MSEATQYLQGDDISLFCSDDAECKIGEASRLIDGYLQRKHGLLYGVDFAGQPAYMLRKTPENSFSIIGQIEPGQNVAVSVSGGMLFADMIGAPIVIDRKTSGSTEVCVISAINQNAGQIILSAVQNVHLSGASAEFGLQVIEERSMPNRSITRVAQRPIARLVAGSGRYSYGRRSDQVRGSYLDDQNLLADLSQLGGAPQWMQFNPRDASVNSNGEIFIPIGLYLYPFNEVRVFYVAGWSYENLPEAIKQATANIAEAICNNTIPNGLKSFKSGPIASQNFSDSKIDSDTKFLLDPYRARTFA